MNTIKNSYVYKMIESFILALEKSIKNSFIYHLLTKEVNFEEKIDNSLIMKVIYSIIQFFRKIFCFIKLDKLFSNSIFRKTYIWLALLFAVVPFIPTMATVFGCIFVIGSFILNIMCTPNFKFRYTPVNIWVALFLLIYVVCACVSLIPMASIKVLAVVGIYILMYFVVINSIETRKQINTMIYVFIFGALIVALYGIYQYLFGNTLATSWIDRELFEGMKTRVYSTFENPNVLAEYLLLVIPLCISLCIASKKWSSRIAFGIIACIFLVCLAVTFSRGSYIGILVAGVVFALILNLRFIFLFIAGLVALPFVLPQSIISRFSSITNLGDSSTQYRLSIWQSSVAIIKDYWYRPIGQSTDVFKSVYPIYAQNGVSAEHAHNWYLQNIVETGILGFIVLIGIIYRFFQYIFNGIKKAINFVDKIILIGFASGLVGYMIEGIFDNVWYNYRVILIFWIFIALAVRYKKFIDEEERMLND